jgi:hypothetical protein
MNKAVIEYAYEQEIKARRNAERAERLNLRRFANKVWHQPRDEGGKPLPPPDRSHHGQSGNGQRTHCQHGHEFTVENTAWQSTGKGKPKQRRCRQCMRDKQAIRPTRPEVLALIRGEK